MMTSWLIDEATLKLNPEAAASVFTVGNGLICTRGTPSDATRRDFRGVYVAGRYTRAGYARPYPFTAPDWTLARLECQGGPLKEQSSTRRLDMRNGVLERRAVYELSEGGSVRVVEERLAAMSDPCLMAQRLTVSNEAKSPVDLVVGIDGVIFNQFAKYYVPGELPNCPAEGVRLSRVDRAEWLADDRCRVDISALAVNARYSVVARIKPVSGKPVQGDRTANDGRAETRFTVKPGQTVSVEKIVRIGLDEEKSPLPVGDWESHVADNVAAWGRFWEAADVEIEGDDAAQRAVRFAIWSTRIAAPNNGGQASIGAKNLTGDWYLCGVFWDMDMFQLPLLAAVEPELAANHIRYRYRRLDAARSLAAQDGYAGARFPWTSYGSGFEEPPDRTFSYQEVHINGDVMWGILHYHALSGDDQLMLACGLEILVELSRYWRSRCTIDDKGVPHILNVTGPDEEHQNTHDNAYTNLLVREMLAAVDRKIIEMETRHPRETRALLERLRVDEAERGAWRELSERMYVPMITGTDVPAQFENWESFPEPDAVEQAKGYGMDRCNKQADMLMIYQAVPDIHDLELQRRAYATYAPLGNHTSSLSMCVHACLAARYGFHRDAMKFFAYSIGVDLDDTSGNTSHGIHGAGEGGIWVATVHGFGGFRVERDGVTIDPQLPRTWSKLSYHTRVGGNPLAVTISSDSTTLRNEGDAPVTLRFGRERRTITLAPRASETISHRAAWQEDRLEAVIFDLDGVLVTTDGFHYKAWKELADELGMEFDETVNHQLRGVSRQESLRRMYAHNKRALPDDATFTAQCTRKNTRYVELIDTMRPECILPGAVELLEALRAAGIKIGLASASRNASRVLARTGIAKYIDVVGDGTIVTASKPSPQVFYLAGQRLRCMPWNCLGVEDAAAGVESILRAGMTAIGIGDQAAAAALVVAGTHELTLWALQDAFLKHEPTVNPYYERNLAKMKAEQEEAGKKKDN